MLGYALKRSEEESRKILLSFLFIILLIGTIIFITIPFFQFMLYILIIMELYYVIFVHGLPPLYQRSDSDLFREIPEEPWHDLKVNETIIKREE